MKARKSLTLTLALSLMIAVSGCGTSSGTNSTAGNDTTAADTAAQPSEDTNGAADDDSSEKIVLEVLTHRLDRIAEGDGDGSLEEMTKEFEEANNCTVHYFSVTEYPDIATQMVLDGGEYADVLMIPDAIKLQDLDKYFEPLGDYETLSEKYNCTNRKMYDGTVYGLSHLCTIEGGICYNKRIWDEAGITQLPVTPEEFINDLKLIRDNTDAIPLYSNYKDGFWTFVQWQALVIPASGNPNYQNDILINGEDVFVPGGAYYELYKLFYDVLSDPTLIDPDPENTNWDNSKGMINRGEIATMVMGSWAVSQFAEKGDHGEDMGYMPAPFNIDGRQFAQIGADYCLGINKNISDEKKELGKKYITWFIEESGFAEKEGGVSTLKKMELPPHFEAFSDVWFFTEVDPPEGLVGVWDAIDNDSGLGTWTGAPGNFKLEIAAAALAGKDFSAVEEIYADNNKRWAETRDANPDYIAYKANNP